MLAKVQKRVVRAGVQDRVELHQCEPDTIALPTRVDFVPAFWIP